MEPLNGITITLTAVANCPANTTIGVNTVSRGEHSYSITNNSEADILLNLHIELRDSDGNRFESNDPIAVAIGDTERGNARSFFNAVYNTSGAKTVTAISKLTGAIADQKVSTCTFQVSRG